MDVHLFGGATSKVPGRVPACRAAENDRLGAGLLFVFGQACAFSAEAEHAVSTLSHLKHPIRGWTIRTYRKNKSRIHRPLASQIAKRV